MQRPCSQHLRTHGFEPSNEPTDLTGGANTLACADYCDEDIGTWVVGGNCLDLQCGFHLANKFRNKALCQMYFEKFLGTRLADGKGSAGMPNHAGRRNWLGGGWRQR